MTAKQLKNSILQQAIQGKLIKQNKEDKPASELLKRIKAEREKLIKSGKIKINKNISAIYRKGNSFYEKIENEEICIDEELPFEIPKTWEWVRFSELIYLINGTSYSKSDISNNGIRIIRGGNIQENRLFIFDDDVFISKDYFDKDKNIKKGDIIIVASTGSKAIIGKPAFINENYKDIQIGAFLRIIRSYSLEIVDYINIIFQSYYYREHIRNKVKGTNINNIKPEYIENLIIPLPPIEEQKRIVNKLNQLMPLIEEYEEKENKLNELDKKFPERLKKSILKEAVEGKLINQNKEDKPASELLKRIKAEREKLIKSGKIKINKNISAIYRKGNSFYEKIENEEICIDEELPFEIPKTWEWTKLSFVSDMFTGNSINENEKNLKYKGLSEGYFYVATKDVNFNNEIDYYNGVRIPKNSKKFRIAPKNSILFCVEGGSAGKKIAITDKDICFGNKLCCFVSYGIDIKYLYYYIQSPMFIYDFKRNTTGIIGGVSINTLKQMFLPLPPIEEQKRIVEKLDKLINACEELKKILFI